MDIPKIIRTSGPLVRKKGLSDTARRLSFTSQSRQAASNATEFAPPNVYMHDGKCPLAYRNKIQQSLCSHTDSVQLASKSRVQSSQSSSRIARHYNSNITSRRGSLSCSSSSSLLAHNPLTARGSYTHRSYRAGSEFFSSGLSIRTKMFLTPPLDTAAIERLSKTSWASYSSITKAKGTKSRPATHSSASISSITNTTPPLSSVVTRQKHNHPPGSKDESSIDLPLEYASIIGTRRLNLKAMLRVRLKQEQIKRLRALPRHSLQLLGLNGNIGTNRPRRLFTQREKRQRRNKSRIAASAGSQPYTHIHYHGVKGYDPRRRLLGFQHFLNNFRDESARGQLVYKRMQQRREQEVVLKRAKQKNSARRPIVQLHKQRLDQLRLALRSGQFRRATHLAKVIFKRYSVGVNLPSAQHLLRLVKVDQTRYLRARRAYLLSDKKQSPSQLQVKQLLTTKELNVILTQCEGAKEWSHGYLISEILLRRYLSKKFTFGASPVDFGQPNSRTIHLMAGHFTESRHPERAMLMFYTLTARYPTTISLNIYESFLCRLAKLPGRFAIIEATLKHLEKHGPQPTTALYNVVLKAISWKESADRLHLLLKSMMAEGFQPNKETYMLLIAKNLSELNLQKAYQWLAELERQGFEVHVSSFEPFMKLCTEQVAKFGQQRKMVDAGKHSASQSKKDMRLTEQSQEWLNHGLRVFQTLHDRKMIPTMKIYNWLIEALLAESRVSEARKVLVSMMDVHLYTPTQRTWSLFFNHYLSKGDYVEANRILSKMRQHPNPVIESSTSLQGKKPFGPIYPEAPVPTKMYRTLFRHVLDNWSVSFAERNVYEMMVHQDRSVRPTEKQVQDLIWKLGPHPEAAERVYVLLYPQTQSKSRSYGHARGDDSNRIVTLGPIQMSQVGVMNAKSRTSVPAQHEDVWRAWRVMTQFYQKATSNTTNNHVPTTGPNSRKSVLSCAFEQVARASRKLTTQEQQKEQARIEQAERLLQKPSVDGWDFGPARRGPSVGPASVGLGLRFGLVGAGTGVGAGHGQHLTDHLQIKGKNRHLIQQMLKRPDFLQPLLDQQNAATSNSERRTPDAARVDDSDTRLQNLLSSYEWMRNHEVPIQPSAMHMFLESLISHGDFKSVRETLDQMSSSRIDKRTIDLVAKYREEF